MLGAELSHQAHAATFHRRARDSALFGDFTITLPLHQQSEHFLFRTRERRQPALAFAANGVRGPILHVSGQARLQRIPKFGLDERTP